MGEKLVVGPVSKGLKTNVTPFNIDNDSFPVFINAYQWRQRVLRKRGTSFLGRLTQVLTTASIGNYSTIIGTNTLNIFTGLGINVTEPNAEIRLGNLTNITIVFAAPIGQSLTDTLGTGVLTVVGAGPIVSATINYSTGIVTIVGSAAVGPAAVTFTGAYYPNLPVMGLRDFGVQGFQFPATIGFDTRYPYDISTIFPYNIHNVNFYKNPPTGTYAGYTQKATDTSFVFNGQDYQQFWTTNYQGAMWATNGITVPFNPTNVGMQFKPIVDTTVTAGGPPAIVTIQITGHGLVVGDFLFINEVQTTTGINFQTGYVINVIDANNVSVEFPNATIAGNGTLGIAQYLTNVSDATKDCIKWYDGDPTLTNNGWVNFCPPLSQSNFGISDLIPAIYYLVGARMIVPFKDRLLFFGPVVQAKTGNAVYLQDTVVYSQNGTPYYTCSYTNITAAVDNPTLAGITFNPILVPDNQTATSPAFFEDSTGFGGFIQAGLNQPIQTVDSNEDVLIVGFSTLQTRLAYTGNDVVPFSFYLINSELGSSSTFSSITTDEGVITRGDRGYLITSQVACQRIDIEILDQVFETHLLQNGIERITAARDFINEWIYFTYPSNAVSYRFPNQTLQYNYRESTWGIFNETYTTYGSFRRRTGLTWATVGKVYPTWSSWNAPWNAGTSTLLQPEVIAGNQQGFVVFRDDGTNESDSLYIQSFSGNQITSPDHCLNDGDYIVISGCLGTISTQVNGKIFSVYAADANTFRLNPSITSGTYLGGGLIKRMYRPFIQTKQFPVSWGMSRKVRIGPQQYLFTKTANGQVTLLIFLSQNADDEYNGGPLIPNISSVNNSLIYSTVLFTCPESANLGLTTYTSNLNTPTSNSQEQIWHRINTSLIGDTVQLGFTMSDAQMRDVNFKNQFAEIELHGFIMDVTPSQLLV